MNVYRRYFKVTEGPLIEAVQKAKIINDAAYEAYNEIGAELGAKPGYYAINNRLTGFMFDKAPSGEIFRKIKGGGYFPKKNNAIGKELVKRLDAVKTESSNAPLSMVGLSGERFPRLFGAGKVYYETIVVIPEHPPVVYISVPWYDEDPEKIEQYKADRATRNHINQNLDAILWLPTAEMFEVKKWTVDRHIDKWNESAKKQ